MTGIKAVRDSLFCGGVVRWQSGFLAKTGAIIRQEHVTVDRHVGDAIVPEGDSTGRTRSLNCTLALALRLSKNR